MNPIGELGVYYVHPGAEPEGVARLSYTLSAADDGGNPSVAPLKAYAAGRYPADERTLMVALPGVGGQRTRGPAAAGSGTDQGPRPMPIVHVIIPADFRGVQSPGHGSAYGWENMHAGLDGIAIDLPALHVRPTHGELVPMNLRVKDPVWPMRDMLDVNFSVKPGEAHTLWLDTRDRVLPEGKSLYLTIASASPEFGAASLEGAAVRLVFKRYEDALPEQIADAWPRCGTTTPT